MGPWHGSGTTVFDIAETQPHWRLVYHDIITGKQSVSYWPHFERPHVRSAWIGREKPVYMIRVIPK